MLIMMSDDTSDLLSNSGRALLGFVLAPLAPCTLIFIIAAFQGDDGGGVWFMSLILPISYGTSLLVGGPVHLILTKTRKTKLGYYVVSAIMATFVPILAIFVYPAVSTCENSPYLLCILPSHYLIMGVMFFVGILISVTFWFIARPDRLVARNVEL